MKSVRSSISENGISRAKIVYHFQLEGAKSARLDGGARGGFIRVSEKWDLENNYRLVATKRVGRNTQITPLKDGESLFAIVSAMIANGKFDQEPPRQPYFDSLSLYAPNGQSLHSIYLPPKSAQ